MLKVKIGNIFDSSADVLVNTINCVGVMGKGIVKIFKGNYPLMFEEYKKKCELKQIKTGALYPYYEDGKVRILNFPTKEHWRSPSKLEYITNGLDWLIDNYKRLGIKSIAFPPLGCGNGGLDWATVGPIMFEKLNDLPIDIEVYAPFGTPTKELTKEFLSTVNNDGSTEGIKHEKINDNWLLVLQLIKCLSESEYSVRVDRIIFQKICYILERYGTDLGLEFGKGTYGPYSPDIKKMITILSNNNLICETVIGKSIVISVTDEFKFDKSIYTNKDNVNLYKTYWLFRRIKDATQAELITTILYSYDQLCSSNKTVCEDQIYSYIVDWKKRFDNKRSESEIREITRYLTYRNFINVDYSNGINELYF